MSVRRYSGRFTAAYFVLAAVAGAAVAVALMMSLGSTSVSSDDGSSSSSGEWSAWQPSASGLGAVSEIANYVAGRYRLDSGNQAVLVRGDLPAVAETLGTSSSPTITRAPIVSFALPTLQDGRLAYVTDTRVAIEYQMCGTGPNCAIPASEGPPSAKRGLLLRREVLELALYTFRYVPEVQVVVVLYPPPAGELPKYVFYLERGQFSEELSRPLDQTLQSAVPLPDDIAPAESATLQRLVSSPFGYRYSLQPDGTAQMVLMAPDSTQQSLGQTSGG